MPFGGLGMWEVFLILLVLLLVFGPRRLPELGGALGKGIREFKRSVTEIRSELTQPATEVKDQIKAATKPAPAAAAGEPAEAKAPEAAAEAEPKQS